MDDDSVGLRALSRQECLALLAVARGARVAFSAGALPAVQPVEFELGDGGLRLRAAPGTPAAEGAPGHVVTFEADGQDSAGLWSVTVTGTARRAEGADGADGADGGAEGMAGGGWAGDTPGRPLWLPLEVVSGLRAPARGTAGPGQPEQAAAVAETHAGIVFFAGDRAYKAKKPIDLGFSDFRTRESRLQACRREVALNRRLAPDVYLGVADVSGTDGELCDHLVVMRRMPAARRLSALVAAGRPVGDDLDAVAALLARFHRGAARSAAIDEAAAAPAQLARWEANGSEMAPFVGGPLDARLAAGTVEMARRFIAGRGPLFEARVADGRACDGHGDVLADDIFCLDDGPRLLDCLDFDDRLRYGDALADAAFLAMDLERLGRPDLAGTFLEAYRVAAGDCWPASLAHHYVAYRAQVRAKVACIRWSQGDPGAAGAAGHLLRLCADHLRRGRVRLVLVGGLPGTGKSTVAQALGERQGATVLRSDEVRGRLFPPGAAVDGPAGVMTGRYAPAATGAVYEQMLVEAGRALAGGETVVLDATWRDPQWRARAAQVAEGAHADLMAFRCSAPLEMAVERARRRRREGADPSEAGEDVVRALWEDDLTWSGAFDLDTSAEPSAAVDAALAVLER